MTTYVLSYILKLITYDNLCLIFDPELFIWCSLVAVLFSLKIDEIHFSFDQLGHIQDKNKP